MNSKITIGIIAVIIVIIIIAAVAGGSDNMVPENAASAGEDANQTTQNMETNSFNKEGIEVQNAVEGDGEEANTGDTVAVHYTGKLENGTVFDSSRSRGEPIEFELGAGRVIKGWEIGIEGMKVGGTRTLVIPPELGYGPQGAGPIPPNATLIFDVELVNVEEAGS